MSLLTGCASAALYRTSSPDGRLEVVVESLDGGSLHYRVVLDASTLVQRSCLSILKDVSYRIEGSETKTVDRSWRPVWGQFSRVRDHYNERTLRILADGVRLNLVCRVYDQGVGLRFSFPEQDGLKGKTLEYMVEYVFDADYPMYHPKGEIDPVGPVPLSSFEPYQRGASIPAVIRIEEDRYLAILESDLYTAVSKAETNTMDLARLETVPGLLSRNQATVQADEYATPWRVLLIGQKAGDLLVNPVPINLAAECAVQDPSWIRTGKTMWDWRVRGYKVGDFRYGADTASIKRFIDFGSDHNVRLFLLDWFWYQVKDGKFIVAPEIDLEEVMSYARDKGVDIILYWDGKHGGKLPKMDDVYKLYKRWSERPDGELAGGDVFEQYSRFGAAGVKYGFRGNNAVFTAQAITKAAAQRLVINFHDNPTPMVGVRRTYPNAVTREYCHAQMDARRNYSPTGFLKMVMINGITGPLDMNNGVYALNTEPGATSRIGWPRSSVPSTVASENARVLVCFSGLMVLPDAPEEYEKKADLFEFIAKMPARSDWDETRVLHSKLAEHITVARRKGEEWFVGSVVNEKGGKLDIALNFLKEGVRYELTLYEDAADTHFETNKESYRVRKTKAESGDVIEAVMAPGGGHSMWIRPAETAGR